MAIVAAVMSSSFSINANRKALAIEVQKAMAQAVHQALADGLRVDEDAPQVRERMMAAREEATAKFEAAQAAVNGEPA